MTPTTVASWDAGWACVGRPPRRLLGGSDHRGSLESMARAEEHLRELLKLPVEDRAHAAKLLLDSLDEDEQDPDAEALRAVELTRRARAVASGSSELVD